MKIIIPISMTEPTRNVMQKIGYFENYDHRTGKTSYIKRLSREMFYPRFHAYIEQTQDGRIINLHLDQKRPSYAGASAHNAEYDSEPVKREAERMKGALANMMTPVAAVTPRNGEAKKNKLGLWERIRKMFS